ncbi:LOW QUALITY PROTEIN: hypothetical protein PHMEG_00033599 [Phytophthora megakarya]|uniref:Uncharacterized protein n=1 Tax=Phytophthora megakarya TaxID=4795 RepID=A0A225UUJ5_9STRA|nr:LOW QUALITY PROTEIN: hypothetical protein PHMEG_00033599 [Phytophthora megakarya]
MSSSDSVDGKKHKSFKIGSSGTPANWNGDGWSFYKHAMLNVFEKSLLDEIATRAATEVVTWDQDKKDAFKKKQAKIKILIQGSLSMKLAKQMIVEEDGHRDVEGAVHDLRRQEEPGHDSAEGVPPAGRATQDSSACKW